MALHQLLEGDFSPNWTHSGGPRIYVHYNGGFVGEIHFIELGLTNDWYFDPCDGFNSSMIRRSSISGEDANKVNLKISRCRTSNSEID